MSEPLIITTAPRDDHQISLTVELGPERTTQAVHRAARAVAQKVRVPGFRPGKAPDATVLRLVGRDRALAEIVEDLGEEIIQEAIEQQGLQVYGQARLEKIETDPIRFSLILPQPPVVELGDLSQIHIVPPDATVSEAEVDALIEKERAERAVLTVVERPAQIGDIVQVDITGVVGEETIMDNHDWELTLRSEGGWLPGFDEAFVGMSAGEEKTFSLTYPEDSASRYRGQTATFHAKVSAVKTMVKPDITDEFARSFGNFASVSDMRTKLLELLRAHRQAETNNTIEREALNALVDSSKLRYPPTLVDAEAEFLERQLTQRAQSVGYKLEDYLRLQGLTLERYRELMREQAERNVKGRLVLRELVKREQITISDAELDAEIARLRSSARPDDTETHEMLSSPEGRLAIEDQMLIDRALARLREIVVAAPAGQPVAPEPPTADASTAAEAATDTPAADRSDAAAAAESAAPATAAEGVADASADDPTTSTTSNA